MPPDPPRRRACLLVREHTFAHYYHPATILLSPQLKILYETLSCMEQVDEKQGVSGCVLSGYIILIRFLMYIGGVENGGH